MSQLPEIIRDIERVDAQVVQRAAGFQAAILADVAGRRGTMHARVAPVHQGMKVAGPAFTVEVRPGDNLMIHAAIALARPGDVLVRTMSARSMTAWPTCRTPFSRARSSTCSRA